MVNRIRHGLLPLVLTIALAGCGGRHVVKPQAGDGSSPAAADFSSPPESPERAQAQAQDEARAIAAVDVENSVFFASNQTELDDAARLKLQAHGQRLKADPKLVVTLVGYTDDLGSPSYNLAIAEQRVNAVQNFLHGLGVPVIQLRRYAVGTAKMAPACRSETCREKMRRVELVYPK